MSALSLLYTYLSSSKQLKLHSLTIEEKGEKIRRKKRLRGVGGGKEGRGECYPNLSLQLHLP